MPQQALKFARDHGTVVGQLGLQRGHIGQPQAVRQPQQVGSVGGQHMGLLVVQVLDAVFHPAQKHIGLGQRLGGGLGHQLGAGQALQGIQRGPGAQLGELPATHNLQQLHRELNFADATATELDIIGPLGPPCAVARRLVADLPVQAAQGFKHAVVQVAPIHKGLHRVAQSVGLLHVAARRHHPAFEPSKTLPLTALDQKILFQRQQRNHRRPRHAVGAQGQVHAKHKAMGLGVADQGVDQLDRLAEVAMVVDLAAPIVTPGGFAVFFVHINQVDVAGDVELARAQLAHAHDPKRAACAVGFERGAMQFIQLLKRHLAGHVQGEFGQLGHGPRDHGQIGALFGVEHHQPLEHTLAQAAQGIGHVQASLLAQPCIGHGHAVRHRCARGQVRQPIAIAAAQALHQSAVRSQRCQGGCRGQGLAHGGAGVVAGDN